MNTDFTSKKGIVWSTNLATLPLIPKSMSSFINKLKSTSSKTSPWGIPLLTCLNCGKCIPTFCFLFFNHKGTCNALLFPNWGIFLGAYYMMQQPILFHWLLKVAVGTSVFCITWRYRKERRKSCKAAVSHPFGPSSTSPGYIVQLPWADSASWTS